jgi:bifunctional DNA primase/polymerase-like protein
MTIKDTAPGGDQGAAGNGRSAGSQDNPNPTDWETGSPYGSAASVYRSHGWVGVLPLPPRRKKAPPSGYTGADGIDPSAVVVEQWVRECAGGNLGLRLPLGWVGIDVDAYGDKQGAKTLAELESRLGSLPATVTSSSRDDDPISGIRLFRAVLPPGREWRGDLGRESGVEIIHHGYGYVVAWPSIHPEGRVYRWRNTPSVPAMGDCAELPPAWIDELSEPIVAARANGTARGHGRREFTYEQAVEFCQPAIQALRDAREGERNNRLNDAALTLSHFAPAFWSFKDVVRFLDAALDPSYPRDEADATIKSAFAASSAAQAGENWKACHVAPVNLPESFWLARPVFGHIRQAAHSRGRSGDLVFIIALARLAAMVSPKLVFDVGLGPGSLNLAVAAIGKSGAGKSAAERIARELLPVPCHLLSPPLSADPEPFRDGVPLGTGEGLAEIFMGQLTVKTGESTARGVAKTKEIRSKVRSNVFVYVDEGETLVKVSSRNGATIGPAIRTAVTGGTLGQANGREATTRIVPADSYSLGIVIGFQRSTAQPLLAEATQGTPQRFWWMLAHDPARPREYHQRPDWPGPLEVVWTETQLPGGHVPREGVITATLEICEEVWRLDYSRGEAADDDLNSHEPMLRCKVAALLALLDGRAHITAEDWELARVIWTTSCAVRQATVEYGVAQREFAEQASTQRYVAREEAKAAAVGSLDGKLNRLAKTLADKATAAGGFLTDGAARQKLHSRNRNLYEQIKEHGNKLGILLADDDGIHVMPARSGE